MRSEEEVSKDILFYEKKADAREHMADFAKKNRRVKLISLIAAILFFAIGAAFIIRAYDNESLLLMFAIIIGILLLVAVVFFAAGAVIIGSLGKYFRCIFLASQWRDAEERMRKLEEKYLDQTVYEDDMMEAEERLIALADKINEFYR